MTYSMSYRIYMFFQDRDRRESVQIVESETDFFVRPVTWPLIRNRSTLPGDRMFYSAFQIYAATYGTLLLPSPRWFDKCGKLTYVVSTPVWVILFRNSCTFPSNSCNTFFYRIQSIPQKYARLMLANALRSKKGSITFQKCCHGTSDNLISRGPIVRRQWLNPKNTIFYPSNLNHPSTFYRAQKYYDRGTRRRQNREPAARQTICPA